MLFVVARTLGVLHLHTQKKQGSEEGNLQTATVPCSHEHVGCYMHWGMSTLGKFICFSLLVLQSVDAQARKRAVKF